MEIKQKKRSEVANEFKWHLNDLFATEEVWQETLDAMAEKIAGFEQYRGKLAPDENGQASTLLACLQERESVGEILSRLYVYAHMKLHEDMNETTPQAMADKSESLMIKFMSATSFIEPEILATDKDALTNSFKNTPGMALYAHLMDDLLRQKAHVLSAELEAVLANAREIGNAAENIYAMLNNADLKFGTVTDEDGNQVELTHGRFLSLMESRNRDVRMNTFNTYYDAFWKQKNTIAATYSASVKKDCFFAHTRKHDAALNSALFAHNIPVEVYTNLIDTVHEFLPEMHRYVRLRKKALNLPDIHLYDVYTPIVPQIDTNITYAEACEKVLAGLAPLGEEYVSIAKAGIESGWIDVYENEGKRSGAYSWGAFGGHPYVLLNFDNKIDDMFTLAHEMGHALHSHFTWTNQPNVYGDYTIFLAEVASTANEALLMAYLLADTTDAAMRKYLINYFLEQFRGTVFRQTMFAEFEMHTHQMQERGEPLTLEALNTLYYKLVQQYFGPDMVADEKIALEWGRIPHFYSAFYVYQYATGFSAAMAFASRIMAKDGSAPEAVAAYLNFLKSGSSNYSIDILKAAGVDMSSPQPVREALTLFKNLLTQMEALL